MIDLKLNEMDATTSFSEEEMVDAIHEYYEASEELRNAEQELFEVNRTCENLEAIQDIVAKYGWSDLLTDLVGTQISNENLDCTCMEAFGVLGKQLSKIGGIIKSAVSKFMSMFSMYEKKFDGYANFIEARLKDGKYRTVDIGLKSKNQKSTEGLLASDNKLFYSLYGIWESRDSEGLIDVLDSKDKNRIDEYISSKTHSIDISTCDEGRLRSICRQAAADLRKWRLSAPERIKLKKKEQRLEKRVEKIEQTAKPFSKEYDKKFDIDYERKQVHAIRFISMCMARSCRVLDAECKRRGYEVLTK